MTILILGGTGNVGSAAIDNLVATGASVRTISRSADKIAALPDGVEGMVADLDDPASLEPVFSGVDSLLLSLLVHPDEAQRGLNAIAAAKKAGVRKVVHISVKHYPGSEGKLFYAAKQEIEAALARSGMVVTVIRPANFFQSDRNMTAMIADLGIYPPPVGSSGIDRIDSRDVGYAAAQALLTDDFDGEDVDLYGPETFTGPSVADVYAEILDRDVRYIGDDLEPWDELNRERLPQWYRDALRTLYVQQQAHGMKRPDDEPQHPLLPEKLRRFRDYAQDLFAK